MIKSKLPNVGTTIFTIMSSLAAEKKAVNLGQGFPDYEMDPELIRLVDAAMKSGYNQYVHTNGYFPLRETIADKVKFLYQASVSPESQVTITPGGTYGIFTALTTVLRPGDEVIVFEPAYDSYIPGIEVNGAIPVRLELKYPSFSIDWQEVQQRITAKTRMIILNSPHNPTGAVLSENDIVELRKLVSGTNILIVSDEVYEHLIYDDIPHQSMLRYPDLLERSFVCFSFGKVFHCTGWKIGYCISSPALMQEFRKVHQFNCFSCHSPSQVALASFLKDRNTYLSLGSMLQEKRDYFANLMSATKFKAIPSHGSYFQCYSYKDISNESERDFAIRITEQYAVASIPVSAFYREEKDNQIVRFCFAKKKATLELAAERLSKIN